MVQATRGREQQHAAAARRRQAEQLPADLAGVGERVGPGEAEAVRPGVMIDDDPAGRSGDGGRAGPRARDTPGLPDVAGMPEPARRASPRRPGLACGAAHRKDISHSCRSAASAACCSESVEFAGPLVGTEHRTAPAARADRLNGSLDQLPDRGGVMHDHRRLTGVRPGGGRRSASRRRRPWRGTPPAWPARRYPASPPAR